MDQAESKLRQNGEEPAYDTIARRIGKQLRDFYPNPESEPIPADHVQMLLELRQNERNRTRSERV